jgi:hypothetical protein
MRKDDGELLLRRCSNRHTCKQDECVWNSEEGVLSKTEYFDCPHVYMEGKLSPSTKAWKTLPSIIYLDPIPAVSNFLKDCKCVNKGSAWIDEESEVTEKVCSTVGIIPNKDNIRTFNGGATRSVATQKLDIEGFLSPIVIHEYCKYLHRHRVQENGAMRASDNWQKGIPKDEYIKSLLRHVQDVWCLHRGYCVYREKTEKEGEITHVMLYRKEFKNPGWTSVTLKDALCGIVFNAFGYLFELIVRK